MRSSSRFSAISLRLLLALATLAPGAALAADPVRVEATLDEGGGSTRLVLSHSRTVLYVVRTSGKRIEILYQESIALEPARQRLESRVLERFEQRDERTVVLFTGPDFERHETFEIQNPLRLVLDFQGRIRDKRDRATAPPKRPIERTIIVLDPGHGGIERGAVGPGGLTEKDVTLDLASRLKLALQRADHGISVVLTRDDDRVLGLDERTAIANHNRADLFVSIHLNAAQGQGASGAETYFLSTDATDDEARRLAALENRASGVSESAIVSAGPEVRQLDLVLWELAQNQYLAESSALAESVQKHLNELTGTRDRGVRQAPFRVLMGATMPAILVEVGFVSNKAEEAKLGTSEYRDQVVGALSAAVQDFLRNLGRLSSPRRRARSEAAER